MVIPASVTNPNNSTLYTVIGIESSVFMNKTNLTSVSIPASMTWIGQQAFEGCTNLKTVSIPEANGVTDVGGDAFSGTKWLNDQPNGVVYVGKVAYLGKNVSGDIIINDGAVSISEGAFLNCTGLTSVTIPNSVTYIGSSAFFGCTNLTSITIPNSVTYIGGSAFSGSGLTSITIPNGVTDIDSDAFKGCTNLTSVTIPNSVTFIDVGAFRNCTSLTSITIPASVQTIMNGAFNGCNNLGTVTVYATTPPTLGNDAFDGYNNNLQIYVFSDLVGTYKGAINWSNYEDIITAIPNQSGNCGTTNHESEVTWELARTSTSGVLTISGTGDMADYASVDDQPWKDYRSSITSLVIGDGVTGIGNNAFNECANLETITLNGGVDIGDAAFPTTGNTSVTIANGLLLHNGTEPLSGTITDMTKLNGKTLQTTVPYTDDNGDPQSTTIDWATVNEGTQADPYMIYHPAQLLLLAYRVNGTHGETANDYSGKYFKLGANIAFSHEANEGDDYAENYEAIGRCENGSTDYNFKGDFDGDGHTVSGIRLRKTGDDYADWCQGLFGQISTGANIHDVNLTDACILGYKYVSGIVGYIEFGTVSNCTVTETAITATYNNCYGTICGDINSGTLQHNYYRHCTVNGTANATNVGCCGADDSKNDGAMPMYVAYIDANGDEQKCTDYTILDNTMTTISAGWYVVKSDVAFSGDLSTNADGEVNIILCDGATLTASKIDPNGNSDQLCIYGQSQGTGTANISGEITAFCAIRIYGGNITAGGIYVINGSLDLKGGTITAGTLAVNGGYINLAGATVEASMYGAPNSDVTIATGITYYDGQGSGYNNGKLTDPTVLNGKKLRTYDYRTVSYVKADGTSATVDARPLQGSTQDVTLGSDGATTWYVVNSDVSYKAITLKGNVNIILCDDKTMTSDGSSASAISGNNNSLTIYGQTAGTGKLVAQSGEGNGISSGAITINGGTVDATGGDYSAINASGNITINGGNVSAKGDSYGIKAGGNITLGWTNANDHIYASSYSETVTIASGLVFTDGNGHNFYGTISDVSAIAGQTLQPVTNAIPYIDEDGTMACCTDFFVIDGSTTYFGNDNGWYVVNSNVTLNELWFTEKANIILCDGAKLTVKNNNVRGDITIPDNNNSSASITVYSQSAGTGAIEAGAIKINTSDITGAFITIYGGNVDINRLEAGFVKIYGGNITVNTAENQTEAAILGNAETYIYGGSVTVTANGCNGIQSNQGNIHIYGGQVTATATGTGCYGISSVDHIRLRWTKATDFIQASSYNVGQNCDVYICDGQMMSDGTTIYSDHLDAQKDAIAGQKLVPYGFKTKANPHESDYWTSFYYGTANYSVPDGVTIYKAAIDGDHVQLTEVSGGIIRAGEAVILKTTASNVTTDGYLILPLTTTDATGDYSGNELKGVDDDTWQEDGYTYYVLSKKGDNFGFFKLASSKCLGAHKAYLKVAPSNNAPAYFGFDENTTSLTPVPSPKGEGSDYYTLDGRKLSGEPSAKGLYIVNGKKVVIK